MDTFILHVKRQTGFTSAAASTKVIVNGRLMASLRIGGSQDFTLPRQPTNIVLMTQVPLGKDIQTTLTIDPRDSQDVTLLFVYKFNAKSLFGFNAFTEQQANIETQVIHGPSVSNSSRFSSQPSSSTSSASSSSSSPSERSQQISQPSGDVKFCTECGFKNPRTAKFCLNCGNKF